MRIFLSLLLTALACLAIASPGAPDHHKPPHHGPITPKVMIVSLFLPEAEVWYGIPDFNLLEHNITLPGLSPLFPAIHCTRTGEICQVILGEGEINAASTVSALVLSPAFNLTKTYFFIAGIAGINPEQGSIADVTFARYAVQVALQYEFDARDKPASFSTGYFPQGATNPTTYPQAIYGTEVFEFNARLRDAAAAFARRAALTDTPAAAAYRANYAASPGYAAAVQSPRVRTCDVATSDVYYSGTRLAQAFANYTVLVTNGTGVYCTSAQEDNAAAAALLRGALARRVDFARIVVMRTASDFERPFAGQAAYANLMDAEAQAGFEPAVQNIYRAGRLVVRGIVAGWAERFERGIAAENYVGDIFDSLAGVEGRKQRYPPTFGLPSQYLSATGTLARRGVEGGMRSRSERLRQRGGVGLPVMPLEAEA